MKLWKILVFCLCGLILLLGVVRAVLPSQLDDVGPLMNCSANELSVGDEYFVVPLFENISIAENKSWCDEILSYGKELGLHGVYHTYHEFGFYRNEEYLNEGIGVFEGCFGEVPESFKPPQIYWLEENNWIRERMSVKLLWNQLTHKVYHCGDSGRFPNWLIRIY